MKLQQVLSQLEILADPVKIEIKRGNLVSTQKIRWVSTIKT